MLSPADPPPPPEACQVEPDRTLASVRNWERSVRQLEAVRELEDIQVEPASQTVRSSHRVETSQALGCSLPQIRLLLRRPASSGFLYAYQVLWLEFPIVHSYPHFQQTGRSRQKVSIIRSATAQGARNLLGQKKADNFIWKPTTHKLGSMKFSAQNDLHE